MCLLWTLAQRAAEVCSERAPTAPRSPPHAAGRAASPSLRRAIIWLAGQTPADSVKRRVERLVPALRSPRRAPGRLSPAGAQPPEVLRKAPPRPLYSMTTALRHAHKSATKPACGLRCSVLI